MVGGACSVEDDPPAVVVNSRLAGAGVVAGGAVVEHWSVELGEMTTKCWWNDYLLPCSPRKRERKNFGLAVGVCGLAEKRAGGRNFVGNVNSSSAGVSRPTVVMTVQLQVLRSVGEWD